MVRHATVRAAADFLDMSHSTVARRIVVLEKGLGVRLFDRTPHGYSSRRQARTFSPRLKAWKAK